MKKKQKKKEPVAESELPPEEPLEEESKLPPEIEQMNNEEPEYEPDFIPED